MPKLDHTGPEGRGASTGRILGRSAKKRGNESTGKMGVGMAKRRKEGGGHGKGRRLQP